MVASTSYYPEGDQKLRINAAIALLSMLLIVGDIHRVELKKSLLPVAGA